MAPLAVNPSELFVPTTAPAAIAPELANDVLQQPYAKEFLPILCLAPGVTIESAEAGLDAIIRRLDEQDPAYPSRIDKGRRIALLFGGTSAPVPRKLKPVIMGFFLALMGLVIALACMNLANMLIARGANRRKEFAIRLAVGASRFRPDPADDQRGRLALAAGRCRWIPARVRSLGVELPLRPADDDTNRIRFQPGLACGYFCIRRGDSLWHQFQPLPALQATKAEVVPALKEGSGLRLPGHRRFGLRNLLMVSQVAASLMLLLMTGFLVIGISKGTSIDTKIDPHSMYLLSLDPVRDGYSPEKAQALFAKLTERLKASAPVSSIALAAEPPFPSGIDVTPLSTLSSTDSTRVQQPVEEQIVGAGYFAALGESMLAGREFEERDQRGQPDGSPVIALPAVLNERAEHRLFGNENAIGKRVRDDKQSFEIVGVVRDMKDVQGVSESIIYLPLTPRDFARPSAGGITVLVRSDAGADALSGIRKEIEFIDPNLNILNVQTLSAYLDRSRTSLRFSAQTYAGIGVFGLILAAIGLAGITAYAVAQRRKEIAIRTALGATQRPGSAVWCCAKAPRLSPWERS